MGTQPKSEVLKERKANENEEQPPETETCFLEKNRYHILSVL